jgi:hypothetical protein
MKPNSWHKTVAQAAVAIVALLPLGAGAQTVITPGGVRSSFQNMFLGNRAPTLGTTFGGYFGVPYGGFYGFADPSLALTPLGMQPVGYGYNGFTETGYPAPTDWDILRSIYAQGYQDAASQQAAADAAAAEAPPPVGMTARPRGAASRVPHGSDGVRAWRVGRGGQVALRWQGDPRIASSVTFELTDRSGRVLRGTTVDQLPAEIHFTPPANAVFYQAVVHYVDGASNIIMGRLPR